jgi:hypothetical protein
MNISVMADREQHVFSRESVEVALNLKIFPDVKSVRVVGFCSGPQPSDWRLYFANPLDKWAVNSGTG